MIVKVLRNAVAMPIIFIDWVTRPKPIERSDDQQRLVEQELQSMTLYQLYGCPFCIKTRRTLKRLNLPMEIRSVQQGSPYRTELEQGGGRIQVPCLKVSGPQGDQWMYESSDIIQFLSNKFSS